MVAVVTGTGLGLERSSGWVIGSRGMLGDPGYNRFGENVTVNAATGNLILTRTDEILLGKGVPDDIVSRNYNSLGAAGDDNADNWRLNAQRSVVNFTGSYNTAGSSVTLLDWDGSDTLYTWDATASAYVCHQGGLAYHRLTHSGTTWTWKDGRNGLTEVFDESNGGRINSSTDADGNATTYAYTANHLTSVTTANGDHTDFTWSGNNITQIVSTFTPPGATSGSNSILRVRYTYDGSNRLSTVTTDLTPADQVITDAKTVVTTYGYDSGGRVNAISQTGGANLAIAYTLVGSTYRVSSLTVTSATGVTRVTSFSYDTTNRITSVTDPNSQVTQLQYDTLGQLTQLTLPAAQSGASAQVWHYTYNSDGALASITDPGGNATTYTYDSNDNLLVATDTLGNTVTRTYDTGNHVLTETSAPGSGQAGQTTTTRYTYDTEGHLRFIVSAEGRVTQNIYDNGSTGPGFRTSTISYRDNLYDVSGLSASTSIAESSFTSWLSAITNKSTCARSDMTYDVRGNIATVTTYSAVDSTTGVGITTQPYTVVTYVYDQAGNLLTRQTSGIANTEVFTYDGLNRTLTAVDLNSATTTTTFTDSSNTAATVVTATGFTGITRTSTTNLAGEVISYVETGSGYTTETTGYKFDSLGHLRMVTDPLGNKTYFLYDNVGRKVADIAADGQITEYKYDAGNRLVATIRYATLLTSTQLATLVDGSGNPTMVLLSTLRPSQVNTGTDCDIWQWRVYDVDNRLVETIDGSGDCVVFAYDNDSNLVSTTAYANKLASVSGFKTTLPTSLQLPTADSAHDNVSRNFYDKDGLLVGVLDGAGYLSQILYNKAGQKTDTISYVTGTLSTHRATGTFATLLTDVGTSSRDIRNRYYYDDRGLLRFTLDANLRPTEYVYDNAGLCRNTIEYAGPLSATPDSTLADLTTKLAATSGLSTNANNRKSWMTYDAAGRLAYSIDPMGDVVKYTYGAMGQLAKQTRFITLCTASTTLSGALDTWTGAMDTWATANTSTNDRISRMFYDTKGRLVYAADALNYVSETRYDVDDHVVLTIRYAATYSVTDSTTTSSLATLIGGTIPSTAVQNGFSYDVDGRVSDSFDGVGVHTAYTFWPAGQLKDRTVASGTSDAVTTRTDYNPAGRVASVTEAYGVSGEAAVTSFTYDGLGNVLTRTDPLGFVTSFTYDQLGHVLTKTLPIDASTTAVWTYTYDAFGNVLTVLDPRSNTSYSFYDLLNRQTLNVDNEKYATATTYTIGNEISSVTRYFTKVTGTITPGVAPSVTTNGADATTSFTRDLDGRVISSIDALGYHEDYTLNAFGDRTKVMNRLSTTATTGRTDNTFDKLGRLTAEMLYEESRRNDGTQEATSVTNTYSYDSRGDRTQMVEASGLSEHRTTNYTYDLDNRLIQTAHDSETYYDTDIKTTHTATPTETIVYNNRGEVVQTTDASGAKMFFYYDHRGNKIAQVNAVGMLSTWTYSLNDTVSTQRVYGDFITVPSAPAASPPSPYDVNNYRETTYTYDRINRLLKTTVASLITGQYTTSYATTTGSVVITNDYNKLGNIVHTSVGDGTTPWSDVWFFFDKLGRKIAQVDQANFLTSFTLDQNGNATNETRYATALSATPTITSDPATLAAGVSGNANDRITNFTYDKNGRRLTEARTGVAYSTINTSTGAKTDFTNGTATITYTYNALGEVLTKQEATGDTTTYTYDEFGRQTKVQGAAFTDYQGTANVRHTTEQFYDGLNNLTRTVVQDSTTGTTSITLDHVTQYGYGANGRLDNMIDAQTLADGNGFLHNYFYDISNRVLADRYTRTKSDGSHDTNAIATRYDLLGRTVYQAMAIIDGTQTATFGDASQTQYNAYGEALARGVNSMTQENFYYDNGGRMWKSTSGDGTTRLYLYDGNGKQTLVISSDGKALPTGYTWAGLTIAQAISLLTNSGTAAIGTVAVAGMVVTITARDKRGLDIETREPLRQLSGDSYSGYTTATISHKRSYNAFGEISQETDSRNNVTDYSYSTLGKVTQRQQPIVNSTGENGAINYTGRPTQNYYYDLSGRVVAVRDANGNTNTRLLLAGTGYGKDDPKVLKEFHADGGIFTRTFDAFGDMRTTVDEVGKTETYAYDLMDRLETQVHQQRADTTQLTDTYVYDEMGQRIQHYNSQLTSSVKELTDYDMQGRVSRTVDYAGNIVSYGYSWSSTLATTLDASLGGANLGVFGGWTRTTTLNSTNISATETTDYFGHVVSRTDYGGHTYTFKFDYAARATSNGRGMTYSYYNTGKIAGTDVPYTYGFYDGEGYWEEDTVDLISTYQYDVEGNRTLESYYGIAPTTSMIVPNFGTLENATVTYDALNRMTSFTDTGGTDGSPVTINYEYDLNGNVRHVAATYRVIDAQGAFSASNSTQDYWYKYDTMNRFVTTKGIFTGTRGSGTISRGTTGSDITYDAAGKRASSTSNTSAETYFYTEDGYLKQVKVAGTQRGLFARDAMGRVTTYSEYDTNGTTVDYSRVATYNAISQVSTDTTTTLRTNGETWISTTTYDYKADLNSDGDYVDAGDYYQNGVVTHSRTTTTKNGVSQPTSDTKNTFAWFDSAQQSVTTYTPDITHPTTVNTSTYSYNGDGSINKVVIADGRPRTVKFTVNGDGMILQRDESDNQSGGDPREIHYYVSGVSVGDNSNNGTSDVDYVAGIAAHRAVPGTGAFQNGSASSTPYADFDQSYDPINGLTYESAAARYTVNNGDTLQSIAQAVWGDSSYWYMLADANGMDGSETLVAGQSLIVPNKVHNAHNSSDVYKVYDPNQIIGNTSPTAAKPHHGCGIVGMIIMVIVAVVVTYFTAGALTGPLVAAMGEAAGGLAAGVVGAAVGSIVSQGVGLAVGAIHSFSWKSVAESAIAALFSGGGGASSFGEAFIEGVAANALTQGIEMAVGLEKKFDWASVAAAGVTAGVMHEVSANFEFGPQSSAPNAPTSLGDLGSADLNGAANRLMTGMAGALAGAATRSLINGSDFGDNLMKSLPDVIGNTIGGGLISMISDAINSDASQDGYDDSEEAGAIADEHAGGSIDTSHDDLRYDGMFFLDDPAGINRATTKRPVLVPEGVEPDETNPGLWHDRVGQEYSIDEDSSALLKIVPTKLGSSDYTDGKWNYTYDAPTGRYTLTGPVAFVLTRPVTPAEDASTSILSRWPVPGHSDLNEPDPSRGQGGGTFGAPRGHGGGTHTGIDIAAPVGTPVVAADDGVIVAIRPNPSTTYGNQVVIRHANGVYTVYAHLGTVEEMPGNRVIAGQEIGTVGRTGNVPPAADSHLHFEVRLDSPQPRLTGGHVVDPLIYLPRS